MLVSLHLTQKPHSRGKPGHYSTQWEQLAVLLVAVWRDGLCVEFWLFLQYLLNVSSVQVLHVLAGSFSIMLDLYCKESTFSFIKEKPSANKSLTFLL